MAKTIIQVAGPRKPQLLGEKGEEEEEEEGEEKAEHARSNNDCHVIDFIKKQYLGEI